MTKSRADIGGAIAVYVDDEPHNDAAKQLEQSEEDVETGYQRFVADILVHALRATSRDRVPPKKIWDRAHSALVETQGSKSLASFWQRLLDSLQVAQGDIVAETTTWLVRVAQERVDDSGWAPIQAQVDAVPHMILAYARMARAERGRQ